MLNDNTRPGRGLKALIDTDHVITGGSSYITEVRLDLIKANPMQPRTYFDEMALEELAASIRELGVISPITLRRNENGTYQIIAGERRYRASKLAGLATIPAYVKTAADEQVMEMALIENIQREDLNAIEIALTFYRLMEEYHLTQERLSERVGKKRTTIANYLRLLRLPAEIQMGIKDKKIEMGHARAILSLSDPSQQLRLYEDTVKNRRSVRRVEEAVRELTSVDTPQTTKPAEKKAAKVHDHTQMKQRLHEMFGPNAQLNCAADGKGKISLSFVSQEELATLMATLEKAFR